jgi:hypothetical protein
VQWQEFDHEQSYPEEYANDLEIPWYTEPADVYVVFYSGHEVEVLVSAGGPGSAQWPGRFKQTPWERCLASREKKVCKDALPKEFDAQGWQGYCTRLTKDLQPNAETECQSQLDGCNVKHGAAETATHTP